jgi:molybdenum-dependent DNA-binding transcriptional regulator ModE
MKKFLSRKLVGTVAGALGFGGGAVVGDDLLKKMSEMNSVTQEFYEHLAIDHDSEVNVAPQCQVKLVIDEQTLNNFCEHR